MVVEHNVLLTLNWFVPQSVKFCLVSVMAKHICGSTICYSPKYSIQRPWSPCSVTDALEVVSIWSSSEAMTKYGRGKWVAISSSRERLALCPDTTMHLRNESVRNERRRACVSIKCRVSDSVSYILCCPYLMQHGLQLLEIPTVITWEFTWYRVYFKWLNHKACKELTFSYTRKTCSLKKVTGSLIGNMVGYSVQLKD